MEGLNLRRSSDVSKSVGTLASIAGASIVTFYKGPPIMNKAVLLFSSQQNWILGAALLAAAAFSTAAWSIVQVSLTLWNVSKINTVICVHHKNEIKPSTNCRLVFSRYTLQR